MIAFDSYLQSIATEYQQWWQVYTITDVVGKKQREKRHKSSMFNFFELDLMVETVKPKQLEREQKEENEEKTERLPILEGLRKYKYNHVLLSGKPGSGKSTALVRLLLENSQSILEKTPLAPLEKGRTGEVPLLKGDLGGSILSLKGERFLLASLEKSGRGEVLLTKGDLGGSIPILVELRYYRTSIIDLIKAFLHKYDRHLNLNNDTLSDYLNQGQFLLLIDGINELPSQEARDDLRDFRQTYQQTTPMIFTTRDLGVGGDLNIEKKLTMQPLTNKQMKDFVKAYLPETGEAMLSNLQE